MAGRIGVPTVVALPASEGSRSSTPGKDVAIALTRAERKRLAGPSTALASWMMPGPPNRFGGKQMAAGTARGQQNERRVVHAALIADRATLVTCHRSRHARACPGHPRLRYHLQERRGWPGQSPAMTERDGPKSGTHA